MNIFLFVPICGCHRLQKIKWLIQLDIILNRYLNLAKTIQITFLKSVDIGYI